MPDLASGDFLLDELMLLPPSHLSWSLFYFAPLPTTTMRPILQPTANAMGRYVKDARIAVTQTCSMQNTGHRFQCKCGYAGFWHRTSSHWRFDETVGIFSYPYILSVAAVPFIPLISLDVFESLALAPVFEYLAIS